jgi:hypothetical protein
MARFYPTLNATLVEFIREQKIFFTATAPVEGRINLSPKGMDTFRCVDERTVAYLDMTGSGNETAAHLLENGRMTVMFCSFDESPMILRLYGHGRPIRRDDEEWDRLRPLFGTQIHPGERQIMLMEIESAQSSCGFAVPVAEGMTERPRLREWTEKKSEAELEEYRRQKNTVSIDGLPTGLESPAEADEARR